MGPEVKEKTGLMASVFSEGVMISSRLEIVGEPVSGRPVFYSGTVSKNRIVLGISGMGKTNASHALTVLIERFSPSCVVGFGIGGAYPSSGLKAGDIAVATKEVYADEGVLLKDGLHSLEVTGVPLLRIGGKRYFNEFPVDKRLSRLALKAADKVSHSSFGAFITVSACTGTKKRAAELADKFDPVCENMEGAALAHICKIYGIPFVEIRGISNIVEDRDKSKWDIKLASENCQKAVLDFLEALRKTS